MWITYVWWHPFNANDPLMERWCNATFLQIYYDEETNSSTCWKAWGWVYIYQIFLFRRTVPLKSAWTGSLRPFLLPYYDVLPTFWTNSHFTTEKVIHFTFKKQFWIKLNDCLMSSNEKLGSVLHQSVSFIAHKQMYFFPTSLIGKPP